VRFSMSCGMGLKVPWEDWNGQQARKRSRAIFRT
jgi:hypothetical protein